jgi:hypothetical protein
MNIPFTTDEFFTVFEQYNEAVFPLQIILNVLALAAVWLIVSRSKRAGVGVSIILASLWTWMGLVYQIGYFSDINNAAYLFGILFILQGILFLVSGILRGNIQFAPTTNILTYVGGVLIVYALVLYPVWGYLVGHEYPSNPTFGLPCPTTIFTFGILLWSDNKLPKYLLVIPFLWTLIGFNAALSLDVIEDTMLLVAGIVGTVMLIFRGRLPAKSFARVEAQ